MTLFSVATFYFALSLCSVLSTLVWLCRIVWTALVSDKSEFSLWICSVEKSYSRAKEMQSCITGGRSRGLEEIPSKAPSGPDTDTLKGREQIRHALTRQIWHSLWTESLDFGPDCSAGCWGCLVGFLFFFSWRGLQHFCSSIKKTSKNKWIVKERWVL